MFVHWTFGRRLGAGFAFAGLVLIVVGFAGYTSAEQLIENDRWVAHSNQVRRDVAALLTQILNAETGQRGFVVVGRDEFLEPYRQSRQQLDQIYNHVVDITNDNPAQQTRLKELKLVIDRKMDEMQRVIDARQQGLEAAAALVSTGDGKALMDSIRKIIDAIDQDEVKLLADRAKKSEESSTFAKATILWGGVLGVLSVGLVGWLLVRSLTNLVGSSVERLRSSSAELQTAANQQTSVAREQAAAMSEIATTIKELVATARQIADGAQRVAGIAETTVAGATAGDDTVQRTEEAVSSGRGQVDAIVVHMLELRRKSQQVDVILEVINELSEQTNILAINASIEAAGAGEFGRRFGVVADEIRKLADRVGGSTKDIRALIEDIRAAIQTTVVATESGSKAVDAGTRKFRDVSNVFQEIARLVETTTEAAREIELSTKQQTTAVEQVNEAIANVAQASRESEVSCTQTLQAATELAGVARELTAFVQPRVGA